MNEFGTPPSIPDFVTNAMYNVTVTQQALVEEQLRPSLLYKPILRQDGNAWIALYGEDIQVGVVGCGMSPDEAMREFDKAWFEKLPQESPDET